MREVSKAATLDVFDHLLFLKFIFYKKEKKKKRVFYLGF